MTKISEWDLHIAMERDGLTTIQRDLLRVLRMRAAMNQDGVAWPSYNTLAKDTGASARSIKEAVKWCGKNGYLSVTKRPIADGDNETNLYRVTLPSPLCEAKESSEAGEASAAIALGVVQSMHRGGAAIAPKEGIEKGIEEGREHPKAQNAEKPGVSTPLSIDPMPVFLSEHEGAPTAPVWVIDHCKQNGIANSQRFWEAFVTAEANARDRFLTAADWRGIAARKAFFGWAQTGTGIASAREASALEAPEAVAMPDNCSILEADSTAISTGHAVATPLIDIPEEIRAFARERNIPDSLQARFVEWHKSAASYRPDPLAAFKFFARTQGRLRA